MSLVSKIWKKERPDPTSFGRSLLRASRVPAVVGETFRGRVEVPITEVPTDGFVVTLSCIRSTHVRRVPWGPRKSESWLWEEEIEVERGAVSTLPNGLAVPFAFDVDGDCEPTDGSDPNDEVYWIVTIEAEMAGLDFEANFEVPFVGPAVGADRGSNRDLRELH